MGTRKTRTDFTPIAAQIQRANIGRATVVADAIADFIVDSWNAIQAPPAPAAVIVFDQYRDWPSGRLVAHR